MTDLPESFFKDIEKNKSVPGPTAEQKSPWDNSKNDLDKYLDKAQPSVAASELTKDRKIPAGETIRENLYYLYHISKPPDNLGTSGDCTLYGVKVTCVVHVRTYWLRKGHEPVLVDEYDFATQWEVRKLIMICPDGAITDLGVLDLLKGDPDLREDSKIDLSQGGGAGAPSPPVYRPPTSFPEDPFAQLHVREGGIDYLELQSHDWQFVRQRSSGCTITAVYRKRLRIVRKTLPNGPTRERYKDVEPAEERKFSIEIPGCKDGVYTPPPSGTWPTPQSFYEPTQGTSVSEGGENFVANNDRLWVKLDSPPPEISNCYVTATYQAYTRYQKVRVPSDPTRPDPAPVLTAVDPQQLRKFSFRVPGCLQPLFTRLSDPQLQQELRYQDLRVALEASLLTDDQFDLQRTSSLLLDGLRRVDVSLDKHARRSTRLC